MDELTTAYRELYETQDSLDPKTILDVRGKQTQLQEVLRKNGEANLKKNKENVGELAKKSKRDNVIWIDLMMEDVTKQIKPLEQDLEKFTKASVAAPIIAEVVKTNREGPAVVQTKYADVDDKWADPSK